jgi:hypothetical protein
MAAPTKTADLSLLAAQTLSNNTRVVSSDVTTTGVHAMGFAGWIGRFGTTAHVSPWARLVIEANPHTTDNSLWSPIREFLMPAGATIAATTLNGAVLAGASTITVTSATNISVGSLLFLGADTAARFEVVRVTAISGAVLTIDGGCIFAHETLSYVSTQAERFNLAALDVGGAARIRVAGLNGSGQTVYVRMVGLTAVY